MKIQTLWLDLTVLNVNLISAQNNWYVAAGAHQITIPVGHILIGGPRGHIEEDNGTLRLNVIALAQATKFFLPGRIPDMELYWSSTRVKFQWMHLHSHGGQISLLKLAGHVTFDKCCLSRASIANQHQFKRWYCITTIISHVLKSQFQSEPRAYRI